MSQMKDTKNLLDEFDRKEIVNELNEYCDKADCDLECPLHNEKLCRYPNWELVNDEMLIQCVSVLVTNEKQDKKQDKKQHEKQDETENATEVVVDFYEQEGLNTVTNPHHYQTNDLECIDEMLVVFGKQAVINFCNLNAWKYRYRSENKGGQEDLAKADWYLRKSLELQTDSNPIQTTNNKYNKYNNLEATE